MPLSANASVPDPARIDAYVTPYYDSTGPAIRVGNYSAGLASKNDAEFVATIHAMQKRWNDLTFYETYVAAIRLYDLGYRNDAAYWFYTAQYRGRQFGLLADPDKLGSIGDRGFELYHAQDAFVQLVGPYINGYAFGNPDALLKIVRRVQSENRTVGDLRAIYPGVAFANPASWKAKNAQLNQGMDQLTAMLSSQKDQIARQREQNGTQAQFGHLTSKPLPGI